MADSYKILGQSALGELSTDNSTNVESIIYTVPTGKQVAVSSIRITNTASSDKRYGVYFVPSSEVSSAVNTTKQSYGPQTPGFVAFSVFSGVGAYSTNGITWTQTQKTDLAARGLIFANNNFLSTVYSSDWSNNWTSLQSSDGVNWVARQNFFPEINANSEKSWYSLAYGNNTLVVVGRKRNSFSSPQLAVSYSLNFGQSWNEPNTSFSNLFEISDGSIPYVLFKNNIFILLDKSNNITYRSLDGINWSEVNHFSQLNQRYYTRLFYTNGKFFLLSGSGNTAASYKIAYSTDGIEWTYSDISGVSPSSPFPFRPVVVASDTAVVAAGSGYIARSTNGTEWSVTSTDKSFFYGGDYSSASYEQNMLVLVPSPQSQAQFSSDNGQTWQTVQLPTGPGYLQAAAGLIKPQVSAPKSFNKNMAIDNKLISAKTSEEIRGGITLSAGDQIRAYSTSNEVSINVYGVEIS